MQKGFSIIEIVLVLALLSTIGALATPGFSRWSTHSSVTIETEHTRLLLEEAYLTALMFNHPVDVHITRAGLRGSYKGGEIIFLHTPRKGVAISLKSQEIQHLTFYPGHTATPATVLVESSTKSCSIVISLRGRIRSECL